MLKAFGTVGRDVPLMMLGLDGENLTRLMAGEPIVVRLPEDAAGADMPALCVVLIGGRDQTQVAERIGGSPLASVLKAHPPTPERSTVVHRVRKDPA